MLSVNLQIRKQKLRKVTNMTPILSYWGFEPLMYLVPELVLLCQVKRQKNKGEKREKNTKRGGAR